MLLQRPQPLSNTEKFYRFIKRRPILVYFVVFWCILTSILLIHIHSQAHHAADGVDKHHHRHQHALQGSNEQSSALEPLLRSHKVWQSLIMSALPISHTNLWNEVFQHDDNFNDIGEEHFPLVLTSIHSTYNSEHFDAYTLPANPNHHASINLDGSIIMFSLFANQTVHRLTPENIFLYYDELSNELWRLKSLHPSSVLLWIPPSFIATASHELQLISHHLIIHHLIETFGVLVPPPGIDFSSDTRHLPKALSMQLKFLLRYLLDPTADNSHEAQQHQELWSNWDTFGLTSIQHSLAFLAQRINTLTAINNPVVSLNHLCSKLVNTRKYHPLCFPEPKQRLPMLITGLGGSGSHYLSNALEELGFRLPHESIARDGSVVSKYNTFSVFSNLFVLLSFAFLKMSYYCCFSVGSIA